MLYDNGDDCIDYDDDEDFVLCDDDIAEHEETLESLRQCPSCGGTPMILGVLGRSTHCRCRDCGDTYQAA